MIGLALAGCAAFALSACDTPPAAHTTGPSTAATAQQTPSASTGLEDRDPSTGLTDKDAASGLKHDDGAIALKNDEPTGPGDRDARFPVTTVTVLATRATFRSPSGNIGCYLDATIAHCDVAHRVWKRWPPRPASCDPARGADWGDGVEVRGRRAGAIACTSDSALGPVNPVLPYGRAVRAGSMRCVYSAAGARCANLATGHGFTAAAAGYSLF
jgi:hypothetical protein